MDIRKILSTARTEYIKWITNPRMIIMGVMLIFIYDFAIAPLLENAQDMNSPLNILEPFIAVANSQLLILIIPAVYLTLISDFPRTDGNTLFFLLRTGKLNWLLGQVLFVIMTIFTFVGVVFAGTVLPMLSQGFWADKWSLTVTSFGTVFPEKAMAFGNQLITEKLYNQLPPFDAAVQSYLLMMCYLLILALLMLMFNCLKIKIMGLLSSGAVIAFGGALSVVNVKAMWIFPMAHTIIYLHYTRFFREPVFAMWKSAVYFIVVSLVLIIVSIISLEQTNFDSVQDID